MDGIGTGRDFSNAVTNYFYARYQFNATSILYKELGGGVLGGLIGSVGTLAKPIGGAVKVVSLASDFIAGPARARGVQGDFLSMANSDIYSRFQEDFAFRGIVITEVGQPPQILNWPTAKTFGSIEALSTTFENNQGNLINILSPNLDEERPTYAERMAILNQGGHSMEDLLADRNRVFELYSILNGVGRSYFNDHRVDNWRIQDDRIELIPASGNSIRNTGNTTDHIATPDNADGIMSE